MTDEHNHDDLEKYRHGPIYEVVVLFSTLPGWRYEHQQEGEDRGCKVKHFLTKDELAAYLSGIDDMAEYGGSFAILSPLESVENHKELL